MDPDLARVWGTLFPDRLAEGFGCPRQLLRNTDTAGDALGRAEGPHPGHESLTRDW